METDSQRVERRQCLFANCCGTLGPFPRVLASEFGCQPQAYNQGYRYRSWTQSGFLPPAKEQWLEWRSCEPSAASYERPDTNRTIARWEGDNPASAQDELLPYLGGRTIAVCWRPPHGPATPLLFHDDVQSALSWLNHLEADYPAQRENALLLVGVAEHMDIGRALRLTHPLHVGARAVHPRFYIPPTSP